VTLEDIAGFIREGREVQIVDLKSGDDLTRQYLLQIIAEHESRGESVLPINVLTDLVRSYTTQAQSVVPQFLAMSFRDAARRAVEDGGEHDRDEPDGQDAGLRGDARAAGGVHEGHDRRDMPGSGRGRHAEGTEEDSASDELSEIKKQLAELQSKLSSNVISASAMKSRSGF
jgi:polyhydroxyalkanoate synthesis repressor PhaR